MLWFLTLFTAESVRVIPNAQGPNPSAPTVEMELQETAKAEDAEKVVTDFSTKDPCDRFNLETLVGQEFTVRQTSSYYGNATYTYKITIGGDIIQKTSDAGEYLIGRHESYNGNHEVFGDGDLCGSTPRRATITFTYGDEQKLIKAAETSTCVYEFQVQLVRSVCEEKSCTLQAPSNGALSDTCPNDLVSGKTCKPKCKPGYELQGEFKCEKGILTKTATCKEERMEEERPSYVEEWPECKLKSVEDYGRIEHLCSGACKPELGNEGDECVPDENGTVQDEDFKSMCSACCSSHFREVTPCDGINKVTCKSQRNCQEILIKDETHYSCTVKEPKKLNPALAKIVTDIKDNIK